MFPSESGNCFDRLRRCRGKIFPGGPTRTCSRRHFSSGTVVALGKDHPNIYGLVICGYFNYCRKKNKKKLLDFGQKTFFSVFSGLLLRSPSDVDDLDGARIRSVAAGHLLVQLTHGSVDVHVAELLGRSRWCVSLLFVGGPKECRGSK